MLADHNPQELWALRTVIEAAPEFELVCEASDCRALYSSAQQHAPDIILMESDLPGASCKDIIAHLHSIIPKPIIIVIGNELQGSAQAPAAGEDAFFSKVDQPGDLVAMLHQAASRTI